MPHYIFCLRESRSRASGTPWKRVKGEQRLPAVLRKASFRELPLSIFRASEVASKWKVPLSQPPTPCFPVRDEAIGANCNAI